MSYVLRHNPQEAGLLLDEAGWVSVEALLAGMYRAGHDISRAQLHEVVSTNSKKRFEFSDDGSMIRARQGHSVDVDLQYEPIVPPEVLYHGTTEAVLDAVQREGLKRMQRHHVHMSTDRALMIEVAKRRGKPVLLRIDAAGMHGDGHRFFVTGNQVYLTEHVPPQYLTVEP